MIMTEESLIGKIVTYPGASNMWRPVWYMDAGVVIKETHKQVQTKVFFGSIERVAKNHIFKVHNIEDKEKVIEICQRTKNIVNEMLEKIKHQQEWTQNLIEEIANGYEI